MMCFKPVPPPNVELRFAMVGQSIRKVSFREDEDGATWTVLVLDSGQEVRILDERPWLFVDPQEH